MMTAHSFLRWRICVMSAQGCGRRNIVIENDELGKAVYGVGVWGESRVGHIQEEEVRLIKTLRPLEGHKAERNLDRLASVKRYAFRRWEKLYGGAE